MKTSIVVTLALALILATTSVFAQTTVTLGSNLHGSENVTLFHQGADTFAFAQLCDDGWWQAYAGATYSPAPWAQVALGLGLEDAENPVRLGGWVWLGDGRLSFIHLFEDGGSGEWHKTILGYQLSNELMVGAIDRAFYGRGAIVEYALSDSVTASFSAFNGGSKAVSIAYSF